MTSTDLTQLPCDPQTNFSEYRLVMFPSPTVTRAASGCPVANTSHTSAGPWGLSHLTSRQGPQLTAVLPAPSPGLPALRTQLPPPWLPLLRPSHRKGPGRDPVSAGSPGHLCGRTLSGKGGWDVCACAPTSPDRAHKGESSRLPSGLSRAERWTSPSPPEPPGDGGVDEWWGWGPNTVPLV